MPLLDPRMSQKLGTLQLLDDAIAYRLGRLNLPCQDCRPGGRCAEHSQDEHLIAGYQDRYAAAFADALADMDPGDIALVMPPGDDTPPTTAAAVSVALMTQLRELAAAGPAVTELGSGPVVIEQDGPVLVEHPLTRGRRT